MTARGRTSRLFRCSRWLLAAHSAPHGHLSPLSLDLASSEGHQLPLDLPAVATRGRLTPTDHADARDRSEGAVRGLHLLHVPGERQLFMTYVTCYTSYCI